MNISLNSQEYGKFQKLIRFLWIQLFDDYAGNTKSDL